MTPIGVKNKKGEVETVHCPCWNAQHNYPFDI